MKKIKIILVLALIIILGSFSVNTNDRLFQKPANFPPVVYDTANNHLTSEGIALGKKLFYDPILSRNNSISCASCHKQKFAFSDAGVTLSKGIDGKTGSRNTPSLANLAWSNHFFWDGSVAALDLQPVVPMTNHVEMDETIQHLVLKLNSNLLYQKLFKKAFGSNQITFQKITKALSQFLITCISANSKYDKVIRKEGAHFTKIEQEGYLLFQKNCGSCHTEPLFTNSSFANNVIGLGIHKDEGRYAITLKTDDKYLFKVPSLRNISLTAPYMHDGRFATLTMVLEHYSRNLKNISTPDTAKRDGSQLSFLTSDNQSKILMFLQTLTDTDFTNDIFLK